MAINTYSISRSNKIGLVVFGIFGFLLFLVMGIYWINEAYSELDSSLLFIAIPCVILSLSMLYYFSIRSFYNRVVLYEDKIVHHGSFSRNTTYFKDIDHIKITTINYNYSIQINDESHNYLTHDYYYNNNKVVLLDMLSRLDLNKVTIEGDLYNYAIILLKMEKYSSYIPLIKKYFKLTDDQLKYERTLNLVNNWATILGACLFILIIFSQNTYLTIAAGVLLVIISTWVSIIAFINNLALLSILLTLVNFIFLINILANNFVIYSTDKIIAIMLLAFFVGSALYINKVQ